MRSLKNASPISSINKRLVCCGASFVAPHFVVHLQKKALALQFRPACQLAYSYETTLYSLSLTLIELLACVFVCAKSKC